MTDKTEATLAIIAALLVLFTTMLDPRLSAGLAVVLLIAFAVVKLVRSRADGRKPQRQVDAVGGPGRLPGAVRSET